MYSEEINKISSASQNKIKLFNNSIMKYIFASALAGLYVGLGILLIYTIGGMLYAVNSPVTKIVMGISFGIALSLVLMAGAELFTGTNMIMTVGALEKKVSWVDASKIWAASFVGNLLGSIILSGLFVISGLANGSTAAFILKTAHTKMSTPFMQLFVRGILCNILVCLAVWCYYKLKDEAAKLIMIFWCLFAFITIGFEHSVANMTLLSIALMIPHTSEITLGGFLYNLSAATLGNFVGGAVFIGLLYWYISKDK